MTDILPVATPSSQVSLTVGGQVITGWTDVRITQRCEGIPNDFEVGLTSQNPTDNSDVVAYAGQTCSLAIGVQTVVTGYIDRDTNGGDAGSHRLAIIGRGQCEDLVDASAEWKGGQISGSSALQIIAKLAEPYGISVSLQSSNSNLPTIPQFNLNYGETAHDIIDRICTYSGLLYYEDGDGDLVLSDVGSTTAASGIVYGQNVQAWSVVNSMDGRFSDYTCAAVAVDTLDDLGDPSILFFTANDPNVVRHRVMYLVAESVSGSRELCQKRAIWEAARRAGRGTEVEVTIDSWFDVSGALWAPNTLVPVTLPGLRLAPATPLSVSEVTFQYDGEGGTRASLKLLPPAAFQPQPIVIQPTPFATGEQIPLNSPTS